MFAVRSHGHSNVGAYNWGHIHTLLSSVQLTLNGGSSHIFVSGKQDISSPVYDNPYVPHGLISRIDAPTPLPPSCACDLRAR